MPLENKDFIGFCGFLFERYFKKAASFLDLYIIRYGDQYLGHVNFQVQIIQRREIEKMEVYIFTKIRDNEKL